MGPLAGIKVIEMAGLAPGPFCAMMLADLGADVLRIDRPIGPDVKGKPRADLLHRNRHALALNIKSPEGLAVVRSLVGSADALIEGFRPGVMERIQLGPTDCLKINPKLVYGRITGWGQDGPLAHAAGHDLNYIALAGALHCIGTEDEIAIPLNLIGDFAGGGLYLAFGIVCALIDAMKSGKGQVVDAAMIDGVASLMTYIHSFRADGEWSDVRGRHVLDGSSPFYAVYRTSDGKHVTVAAAEPQFYAELLRLTGLDRDGDLPTRQNRSNWPALRERFAALFASKTRNEWCALLEGTDACFAPVLTMQEATDHPHNRTRNVFVEVDGIVQPAPAPRFSRTNPQHPQSAKTLSGGLDDTLERWGVPHHQIQAFRSAEIPE